MVSAVAISLGAIVMFFALGVVHRVRDLVGSGRQQQIWRLLQALMLFFLAGYIVSLVGIALGRVEVVESMLGPVFFAGAVFAALVVWASLGAFKKIQAQREQLESTIHNLRTAQAKLIQSGKLAALGSLATGLAYELNGPLLTIGNTSELLKQELSGDGAEALELVEHIQQAAHRMRCVVANVRCFGREDNFNKRQVSPTEPLESALMLLAEQLRDQKITVERDYEAGLPKALLDEGRMQQVFVSLLFNARDALGNCNRIEKRIRVGARMAGTDLVYLVQDNGRGVPEEHQGLIFDPFFTTKEIGEGTGLGLSLSCAIVGQHRGLLYHEEPVGAGARFVVRIPVMAKAAMEAC